MFRNSNLDISSRENLYPCTNIDFDFERRIWTDGKYLEDMHFIERWEEKFGSIWDNKEKVFPPEPYQPEYVSLKTDFQISLFLFRI